MKCRKLSFRNQAVFLLLFILSLTFCLLPMVSFASEVEQKPEIVQDEQSDESKTALHESDQERITVDEPSEPPEQEQEIMQDEQNSIDFEPDESGLAPVGSYEQFETEYDEYTEYIPFSDTDSEILFTLKSIEYQLKIIAGGMVLALISLFIWFTILKPIKRFTVV